MKKSLVLFVLLVVLAVGAHAHDGMIALFTDESVSDCDADLGAFEMIDVHLFYIRGDGPEMGGAFELRITKSSPLVGLGPPTWHPEVGMATIGSIENGISVAAGGFIGVGLDVVYLGTLPVINGGLEGTFTISVVEHPDASPAPGIYITLTDFSRSMHPVLGGTFVFNGTCGSPLDAPASPTATKQATWGAIKSMIH